MVIFEKLKHSLVVCGDRIVENEDPGPKDSMTPRPRAPEPGT